MDSKTENIRRRSSIRYSKRYARRRIEKENDWEGIITQSLVCAIIICIALIICLIKTPFTNSLRIDLKNALTENLYDTTSPKEIVSVAKESFQKFLGENIANTNDEELEALKHKEPEESMGETGEIVPLFSVEQDFRIDENILKNLNEEAQFPHSNEIRNEIEINQD